LVEKENSPVQSKCNNVIERCKVTVCLVHLYNNEMYTRFKTKFITSRDLSSGSLITPSQHVTGLVVVQGYLIYHTEVLTGRPEVPVGSQQMKKKRSLYYMITGT